MPPADARFFFDFVDPLSWLVERALAELEAARGPSVQRVGLELRPPPAALTRPTDPLWADRWQTARQAAPGVRLEPPPVVPWTRKAHELHLFAEGHDAGALVRRGIFEAYFEQGIDIGRVDALADIAATGGLDRTETRAALDVDAHRDAVLEAGQRAVELGVGRLPALLVDGRLVQGFPKLGDLSTLLGGPPGGGR